MTSKEVYEKVFTNKVVKCVMLIAYKAWEHGDSGIDDCGECVCNSIRECYPFMNVIYGGSVCFGVTFSFVVHINNERFTIVLRKKKGGISLEVGKLN